MDENQLEVLCFGINDRMENVDSFNDEMICTSLRGKFRSNRRTVPRLPLAAMISRMKLLEDSSNNNEQRARGRAQLLSDRAKLYRQPGHNQRRPADKPVKIVPDKAVSVERRKKPGHMYNEQWEHEEFPSLGKEHTVEGSPKKKLKSNDFQTPKQFETDCVPNNIPDLSDSHSQLPDQSIFNKQPPPLPKDVVKPKTKRKKEVFDFAKANQSLLEDFPIPQQPISQVLSLTQHNLEKFLRESDSESSCSGHDHVVQEPVKEFEEDDVPLYQKYAVTLDDIARSRYTQVPFNLKGQLATLLNTPDTYHTNPNEYIEKTDAHHLVPDAEETKKENESDSEEVVKEDANSDANSVDSVMTELSDLNSPSDNDDCMEGNDSVKGSKSAYSAKSDTNNERNIEETNTENHVRNFEENKFDESARNMENVSKPIDGAKNVQTSSNDLSSDCNDTENDCEMTKDDERIDIDDAIESNAPEADATRVQKSEGGSWKLFGDHVIQIDGLPVKCDVKAIQDYVTQFGKIEDYQVQLVDGCSSLRFKLESEDACDYAVQCLHGADCLFPEMNEKLSCHHLKAKK